MNTQTNYILVTGGLGFIGSHVVVKLIEQDFNVLVFDNLSNSKLDVKSKIIDITQKTDLLTFIKGDIRNKEDLEKLFANYQIRIVMHFAALKSVTESEEYPELYNDVNVTGTINLLDEMIKHGCHNFIYSSSATVYGNSESPVTEDTPVGNNLACNYAKNKYDMEQYLISNHRKGGLLHNWNIIILRYFNPIGAHPSGKIGEDPNSIPNNVFPYLLKVAKCLNRQNTEISKSCPYSIFTVFGNDYNTRDGTCIRDYVHVQDLARAHVEVMRVLANGSLKIYNVGTGIGTTVMELLNALNNILVIKNKKTVKYRIGDRRNGDIDVSYAIVDKIHDEVGFKTKYDIAKMCEDGLKFVEL